MRLIPLLCLSLLLTLAKPAGAAPRTVTFFLDGAKIEHEATAVKGYLECPLPDSMVAGSLRVKSKGEGKVSRVEIAAADQDRRRVKEIKSLEERKSQLQDRMLDLDKREEIFTSAVKSQSAKAARKTKSNPDPVESLQQGTSFALGQLEAVSRSQRKCRLELEAVERKLEAARKGSRQARVWMTGNRAVISYLDTSQRWTPSYHFRWSGDAGGELLLHAKLATAPKGALILVSNGAMAEGVEAKPVKGDYPLLARYPLTLRSGGRGEQRPLTFAFVPIEAALPPGEAAAYWQGEYLGSGRFAGGRAGEFSIGDK